MWSVIDWLTWAPYDLSLSELSARFRCGQATIERLLRRADLLPYGKMRQRLTCVRGVVTLGEIITRRLDIGPEHLALGLGFSCAGAMYRAMGQESGITFRELRRHASTWDLGIESMLLAIRESARWEYRADAYIERRWLRKRPA